MFQGTGSSVGKSTIVAGLCRALTRRGLRVRPFKPQNMSNNAAVTADGGEIGRAQALQARACGVEPTVHMNPVLLKPQDELGSQVVVRGRVATTLRASAYQRFKVDLLPCVLDSFRILRGQADIVLVEGAGSASEINLRNNDIANMGFACASGTPVVLVGDIDRGGVIASLVGTHTVLPPADRGRIAGFLVNRMRGDPSLFTDGMRAIAEHTGWLPLGLVPHADCVRRLPAEDAADFESAFRRRATGRERLRVTVPRLPAISNLDDLDPLLAEEELHLELVPPGRPLPAESDLVLLPGSKATIADLLALRTEGWDIDLLAHRRRGGCVIGICGGYQMLGRRISDPDGSEGRPGTVEGLSLLDVETVLGREKRLARTDALLLPERVPVSGYEIHLGMTDGPACRRPLFEFADGRSDGACSEDGRVLGGYLHGLFDGGAARAALLRRLGAASAAVDQPHLVERALDELATHLEAHVDIDGLLRIGATAA